MFTPICAECHQGSFAPAGLSLAAGEAFANIVGVTATEVPSLSRIAPGDPDNSWLIQKISLDNPPVGGRMPLGGPPLDDETINFIRQWVADGALPGSADALLFAPRMLTASISQDSVLNSMPDSVNIVWSSPIDNSTFDASTVSLLKSNDGVTTEDTSIAFTVADSSNPYVTTLEINDPAATSGNYQLQITGDGDIYARSFDARAIDGDGDGIEGGTLILDFSVE